MRSLPGLLLLFALSGCAGSPPPADQYYRLSPPATAPLARPVLSGVVEVGRLGAEGLTGDRAILYSHRDTPSQLARSAYRFWSEPPPVLLADRLVDLLRDAQAAPSVVSGDLRVSPDILIEGRLHRFEQVLGNPPAVVVDLELGVIRLHGAELRLLKRYQVEQPLASDSPADAAAGFDAAVGEVFRQFLADLGRL
jgi:cholesterol transport system auxiliary component